MHLQIPDFLTSEQVAQFTRSLREAEWIDGRATAGHLSSRAKENRQLHESHPTAIRLGNLILDVLERHAVFMSFALPSRIVPPLFNSYEGGQQYGRHIDGAIRPVAGHSQRVRTDISATLFLSRPDDYEGGDLVIEEFTGGLSRFKLPAGTLLLYPGNSVHHVEPVTRGCRLASFFWLQSLVRENERRLMLFNLDNIIQKLRGDIPDEPSLVDLTGHYHNLVRLWAEP